MATSTVPDTPQTPPPEIFSTARTCLMGLVWGAIMLFVLGFWIRAKYEGQAVVLTNLFLFAGVAAAGLAIWQAITLWVTKESPDQKSITLTRQLRIHRYVLMAAGLAFVILAFVLAIGKKPGGSIGFIADNVAEFFGVLLLGFICLGSSYTLSRPLHQFGASFIQSLLQAIPLLKLICLLLGLTFIVSFFALPPLVSLSYGDFFARYFPEMAALVAMNILSFSALIWLNAETFDEFGIRLFVLVLGGITGVILFLLALGRAYLWRSDVVGGIAAWQGENAWRFWVCAYLLFISLVLMFISFNLARTDIRNNYALRLVMYGYDTLAQAFLLIGILIVLNVVAYARFPFTFDWTKTRGAYDLSENTKNLISNLKQEVNIFVLMTQNDFIFKDLRNLLDNCQALSNKLKVTYISPDADSVEYEKLAEQFPKLQPESPISSVGRGVLVVYGAIPKDIKQAPPPNTFVERSKLFKVEGGPRGPEKSKKVFKAEGEILKELRFLVQDQKKQKIYVLQGNDEVDMKIGHEDPSFRREIRSDFSTVGIGMLVDRLNKENFEVVGLSFNRELAGKVVPNMVFASAEGADKKKDVPADCKILLIAGETKALPTEVIDAIDRYIDRGGKTLVCLDVAANPDFSKMNDSGLELLLKRYGVDVTSEFALRLPRSQRDDPRALLASGPPKTQNRLAQQFVGKTIIMKLSARVVKPAGAGGRYKADTVLQLRPDENLLEKNLSALQDPIRYILEMDDRRQLVQLISREPTPVAVSVTDSNGDKPCMVVVGDTEFITNRELMGSATSATNYNFIVSALDWMAEREGIGALPKESPVYQIDPSVNLARMIVLPGWLMLLTLIGLGVGIWVVRRR